MRGLLLLVTVSTSFAVVVACATTDADAPEEPPQDVAVGLPDGGNPMDAPFDPQTDADLPAENTCSAAGWCTTQLPDSDLTLTDIWPFEKRAFAIAETPTQGIKVLEWEEATNAWTYIDDGTQNDFDARRYSGTIWAPSENEVYFGAAPSFIYHGTRATPSATWKWTRSRLEIQRPDASTSDARDPGSARIVTGTSFVGVTTDYAALGVWGTSKDDVYAWYGNTLFHRTIDGEWVPEYEAVDDVEGGDTFFFFGADGSGRDDVWFTGIRGRYAGESIFSCPIVVHKNADGYRRLVDHTPTGTLATDSRRGSCGTRAGARSIQSLDGFPPFVPMAIRDYPARGWVTRITSVGPNAAMAIYNGSSIAYFESSDADVAMYIPTGVRVAGTDTPYKLRSIWAHGERVWMSGWGLALHTPANADHWRTGAIINSPPDDSGAPTVDVSTLSLNGGALDAPIHQVRGTSNTNLWAVGARYALHKTTP